MKHIDSHIHLYPKKLMDAIFRYFEKTACNFPYRQDVPESLAYLRESGMEKGFLLLYAHKAGMARDLNHWAFELCLQNPDLVPFACFHPEDPDADALVKECLNDWGFAGFKLHFNVQRFSPDDPRFAPVYSQVQEQGKAMVMHIGPFPSPSDHLGASKLLSVLRSFPRLKVLVAHLGFYDTEKFWRIMDQYPTVYLDTAFILGNPMFPDGEKIVAESMKRFPDRILYGSDFPLIRHDVREGLAHIGTLSWDENIKKKLLYENAENFLRNGQPL
ncbi:MAG: amidohydrolase [Dethiobacter sp.]|jgi:predicted TIM-barrel fold metal-dependent hydrolase|nr:amidohydrolase [Dethiobacter sp.]